MYLWRSKKILLLGNIWFKNDLKTEKVSHLSNAQLNIFGSQPIAKIAKIAKIDAFFNLPTMATTFSTILKGVQLRS